MNLLVHTILPKSQHEDLRRREFILNILLVSVVALLAVATLVDIINTTLEDSTIVTQNSVAIIFMFCLVAYVGVLFVLSRLGKILFSSYLLVASLYAFTTYLGYIWGIDVPAEIIFYPLVIIIAGILLDTKRAFAFTGLIAATLVALGYLQNMNLIQVNHYWKQDLWTTSDIFMIVLIYTIIATVAWLGNRETERSLMRARNSEAALTIERDFLEVRV